MEDISKQIKEQIIKEFLPRASSQNLNDSTPLISGGILDSVKILQLVSFLEETFQIQVEAHEVNTDNLDTIRDMARFVISKRRS